MYVKRSPEFRALRLDHREHQLGCWESETPILNYENIGPNDGTGGPSESAAPPRGSSREVTELSGPDQGSIVVQAGHWTFMQLTLLTHVQDTSYLKRVPTPDSPGQAYRNAL